MPARRETAVFDASPLIFLARVDLLDPGLRIFSRSLLPDSVRREVVVAGRRVGAPEAVAIGDLVRSGGLLAQDVPKDVLARELQENPRLSAADVDCLVLARTEGGRLLADETAVRSAARHLGISLGSTLSVLLTLVQEGELDPDSGLERLDQLVQRGWYCSTPLYRSARAAIEGR